MLRPRAHDDGTMPPRCDSRTLDSVHATDDIKVTAVQQTGANVEAGRHVSDVIDMSGGYGTGPAHRRNCTPEPVTFSFRLEGRRCG
jgi:hypothetical protein